ncbi:MAG: endolytic transglycosylase MltG [Lachnospiraceae bacterium]|nr:endolytic transglycosylase MltG [Lachnospiraceae bacterium]
MSKTSSRTNTKNRKNSSSLENWASGIVGGIFNIVLVVVILMVIYRFSVSAYQYGIRIFGEPPMSEAPGVEVTVEITDGMDFDGIAQQFYDKGLVRDKNLFKLQEYLSNYTKDGFIEGTYTVTTAMTAEEMMDVIGGLTKDE